MIASTWRGRVEWAALVAVIFSAGYFGQTDRLVADDAETAGEVTIVAEIDADDEAANEDGEKQVIVEVEVAGDVEGDLDVENLPASKKIKRIIRLSGDENAELESEDMEEPLATVVAGDMPSHYIGVHAGKVDPLLAKHLKLDDDTGVVVLLVVKDSPAEKAGVQKHDILVSANGKKLGKLTDLVDLIRENKGNEITLELIRDGEKKSLSVTPEERTENSQLGAAKALLRMSEDGSDDVNLWVEKLQKEGALGKGPQALRLRSLGPGLHWRGESGGLDDMPANLSVRISKKDSEEAAQVVVKQGDDTWKFASDDEKAIGELPEEIQKFVKQMVGQGGGANFAFGTVGGNFTLPGNLRPQPPEVRFGPQAELVEQLKAMQKQLEELQEQVQELHEDGE